MRLTAITSAILCVLATPAAAQSWNESVVGGNVYGSSTTAGGEGGHEIVIDGFGFSTRPDGGRLETSIFGYNAGEVGGDFAFSSGGASGFAGVYVGEDGVFSSSSASIDSTAVSSGSGFAYNGGFVGVSAFYSPPPPPSSN